MENYREYLLGLIQSDANQVFFNSGPEHAAIVSGLIFKNSNNSVKIVSGGTNPDVVEKDDYLEGLDEFLKKTNSKIEFVFEDFNNFQDRPKFHKLLKIHHILNPDKISICINPTLKLTRGVEKEDIHFMLGDKKMYRIENNITRRTAEANFNDIETVSQYEVYFSKIKASASPLNFN